MKAHGIKVAIGLIVALLFSHGAFAQISSAGVLDDALGRYQAAATSWGAIITNYATWLFWALATISMVITFGFLALQKADISDFFAEFVRFTLVTGFFWWLCVNGPAMATAIINSLRSIGAAAIGAGPGLSPSGIVDAGFDIFFRVLDQSTVWSPVDSAVGMIIGAIVLVVLALVAVNMLILLIAAWILTYAGIFFLGFGGSKWTSDMAISYFRTVLGIGAQLFTMVLLVGIGRSFLDSFYNNMSAGISLKEMGIMLIVSIVLLALVSKVPPLIGQLAGSGGAAGIGTMGAGSAMAGGAFGAAALATAGASLAAGATSAAGGASALMEAFKAANAAESGGGGGGSSLSEATAGASGLAAMGSGGSSLMGSSEGTGDGSVAAAGVTPLGAAMGDSGPSSGSTAPSGSGGSVAGGGAASSSGGSGTKSAAGKVARVAAGTMANLARGTMDVGKNKMGEIKGAALDRISQTTGGKIATAIKERAAETEGNNFLSAGLTDDQSTEANPSEEIASFVNQSAGDDAAEQSA